MREMGKLSLVVVCILLVASVFTVDLAFANKKEHQHHQHSSSKAVKIYELKKGNTCFKFTNWGATIISAFLPDKYGKLADIVLGYDDVKQYANDSTYFGAVVGRVANRIAEAKFTLNGTTYKLVRNEGRNMLHGGKKGFSDVVWQVINHVKEGHAPHITFSYHSKDGEQGFPGNLAVTVTYMLHHEQSLSVQMLAIAQDKATPVNLAQHTYWNLGGHDSGDILSNKVQLFASHITPTDNELIPTGKIDPVKGTPYDFLQPHTVGSRINELPKGYDINYVLDAPKSKKLRKVAMVHDPKSGRVMELMTNQPGVQFYTSNMLKDVKGKDGVVYGPHAALCLETQGFPDAVNHPNFPSVIVNPGKPYHHFMLFKFSTI